MRVVKVAVSQTSDVRYGWSDQHAPYPGKRLPPERSNRRYYTVKKRATTEPVETTTKQEPKALSSFSNIVEYYYMTIQWSTTSNASRYNFVCARCKHLQTYDQGRMKIIIIS
jgi:hypothetical protein